MPNKARTLRPILRPILVLTLCGLALTAYEVGASSPAAARGGGVAFGRTGGDSGGGGMGGHMGMGHGSRSFARVPRHGKGKMVDRRIGGNGGGGGGSGMPPRGERRFVPDEVVTAFSSSATPAAIDQLARRHNLTLLESRSFSLGGNTLYRWRINGGRPVGDLIGALEDQRLVTSAQPNYLFTLQEDAAKIFPQTPIYAAQYVLGKLQIEQAHHVATGKNILVTVIDSEIDAKNPDLDAAVVKSFDALGGEDKPHTHGTAMAGAIAAHLKLMGIAPGVQLLVARAFDDNRDAKGTSVAIYKSLQWAADNGARVVNMSFAGPADPTLHRILTAAYEKGIVLIAAAGNAGPTSPPLYPAADPDVIAVTATDSGDGLFAMANRGSYIAVAAPGVDILALAPDHALQLTTGTSVATAHVSGLVALLLECKPSLKPADIRAILVNTAKPLGNGAGLVNAYRAVTTLNAEASGKNGSDRAKQWSPSPPALEPVADR